MIKYFVRDVLFFDIIKKNILVFLMTDITSVPTTPGKTDILTSVTDDRGDFFILPPAIAVKNVLISGTK